MPTNHIYQPTTHADQRVRNRHAAWQQINQHANQTRISNKQHVNQRAWQQISTITNSMTNQPTWQSTSMHLTRKKHSLSRPSSLDEVAQETLQTQHTMNSVQPLTIYNDIAPFNFFRKRFFFYIRLFVSRKSTLLTQSLILHVK